LLLLLLLLRTGDPSNREASIRHYHYNTNFLNSIMFIN